MYVEDSASSQFYIVKKDTTAIDGSYALFGRVVKGMEVVDQLTTDDTMTSVTVTPAAK
jgi:cyclophilin family peptidyl-prolyl cis-trans isomerase